MANKKKIPEKYQCWIDARKKLRLSHVHIQMAKELGLNPKKMEKLNNHGQSPWKAPLPVFLEDLYFKRFHKFRPENIRTIEQIYQDDQRKREEKKERKRLRLLAESQNSTADGPILTETGFSDLESLALETE